MNDYYYLNKDKVESSLRECYLGDDFISFRDLVVNEHKGFLLPWLMTLTDSEFQRFDGECRIDQLFLSRFVLYSHENDTIYPEEYDNILTKYVRDIIVEKLRRGGYINITSRNGDEHSWMFDVTEKGKDPNQLPEDGEMQLFLEDIIESLG